ncbi:MAG: putative zinc-binding metallopeptidase [Pseudomonadota bacterium]
MQDFACENCGASIYFETKRCPSCGFDLGFAPDVANMVSLEHQTDKSPLRERIKSGDHYRHCENAKHDACNWLVNANSEHDFCRACRMNRTIPDLSDPENVEAWIRIEHAKKRLVYALLRFGLPLEGDHVGKGPLAFDFVQDATTGHLDGLVTIDIGEADPVERERNRVEFDEPYRSLLGHLRHESGHYYWMLLVEAGGHLDAYRKLFGDERQDYASSLKRHYEQGTPPGWRETHVSRYASAHAWEDWAETWAHYLHMVDALDTAANHRLRLKGNESLLSSLGLKRTADAYRESTIDSLLSDWLPLTKALNSLNRSMGHGDFYPFKISEEVSRKLAFVHGVIREGQR